MHSFWIYFLLLHIVGAAPGTSLGETLLSPNTAISNGEGCFLIAPAAEHGEAVGELPPSRSERDSASGATLKVTYTDVGKKQN